MLDTRVTKVTFSSSCLKQIVSVSFSSHLWICLAILSKVVECVPLWLDPFLICSLGCFFSVGNEDLHTNWNNRSVVRHSINFSSLCLVTSLVNILNAWICFNCFFFISFYWPFQLCFVLFENFHSKFHPPYFIHWNIFHSHHQSILHFHFHFIPFFGKYYITWGKFFKNKCEFYQICGFSF
jgi:hypothetical protein